MTSNNMRLLFSELLHISELHFFLKKLMTAINQFVDDQKYAMIKKRIKISKKKVLRKAMLKCDREKKWKNQKHEKR